MRRAVVVLAAVGAMVVTLVPSLGVAAPTERRAAPPPLRLKERCLTAAERKRVVRFAASDRTRLLGVVLGRGPKGVVLAHQGDETLCVWMPYARRLAASGYRVLAFDHRRHGSSGSPGSPSRFFRVDLDVSGAIAELRRRGATSVVLAGGSLGGAAVLAAAASVAPPVQGVISLSAPRFFFTVDATAAVRRSTVPTLFVAAAGDGEFALEARDLYGLAVATDKRIEIVPGGAHGAPLLRAPKVRALVGSWIAAHSSP